MFLTFPIEIGIYISSGKDFKRLDSFSLAKPKYTLYGDPWQGLICKHWNSDIFPVAPVADLFQKGIIELKISNNHTSWVEINHVVFNAFGMKIYYDNQKVSMKAKMKITGKGLAETEFIDSPLESGMKKSLEIYVVKKLSLATPKFVMELGL
ncbi:DUF432 domain-containing protein [Thermodesulfobacteriota bacterium]